LLVQLLNLHPEIFITPESDIVWILYQARNGWPDEFRGYLWDGPVGMERTFEAAAEVFDSVRNSTATPREIFERVQEELRRKLNSTAASKNPVWIGDKKPVQHCDPDIRRFLNTHFPEAHYLHIIRNPNAVVASKLSAAKQFKAPPEYWCGTPDAVTERWVIHEEWVMRVRDSESLRFRSLRFEDLCQRPVQKMEEIYNFLGLEMTSKLANAIAREVRRNPNKKYPPLGVSVNSRLQRILNFYGYSSTESQ